MARRYRALHFNLQEGENVVFHREHRSKKSRSKMFRPSSDLFHRKKREMEEIKQGVDKRSLRLLRNRYKI